MKILQTVVVKQVLTENSKKLLLDSLLHQKNKLQKECDQLQFEYKKIEKQTKLSASKLNQSFKREIENRKEKINLLDFQLEQIHMLPLGSEIKEKEIQSIVEIEIGDSWDKLTSKTIIIKDGIVEDIR